jgi:hypothetical protein
LFSIQVWISAGLWYDVQNAVIHNDAAIDSIFYFLEHLPLNFKQRFASLCWSLWKDINLKVREEVDELSANVVDRARAPIDDWQAANIPSQTSLQASADQLQPVSVQHQVQQQQPLLLAHVVQQWQPPAQGRLRLARCCSLTLFIT